MRVSCLQHVPFEGPAAIEPWLQKHGHSIAVTRLFANAPLPTTREFDWLIVMGGPMGANDEAAHDWLRAEKALIKSAIDDGKIVLGICLGAQLIAAALNAKVYANGQREIGWFPISRTTTATQYRLGRILPDKVDVFHWHGDTFDLPHGAARLASSVGCLNQAFCAGEKVLALQFHVESTPDSVSQILQYCRDELSDGGAYVQTPDQMLADSGRFDRANQLMSEVLAALSEP